jgi:protein SCO1
VRSISVGSIRTLFVTAVLAAAGCSPSTTREYPLEGQVLAVDAARNEITIKHGDIPQFMPAMTMPFKVRDAKLLEGRSPGDLVKATLVVEANDAHLRTIERVGSAPVTDSLPTERSTILRHGDVVADATFTDETGATRRLSDWRGKVLAVTFVYTRCPMPNFCPAMDRLFQQVQDSLREDEALGEQVHLISVTIDPDYDTPGVLASHARRVKADPARWHFLTGTRSDIDSFARQFGLSVTREPTEIVHNLATAVIDGKGRMITLLTGGTWKPSDLIAGLRTARASR